MGVRQLWEVVGPVAKPIQLESLRKQRLAVDASIWIYQFLKAVRDQDGNVVKYAHIVGFFRRICKLLFYGIRPVFVFDGAAPTLKRETINRRRERREGHRESTKRTAAKLLTLQMQRLASEADNGFKGKGKKRKAPEDDDNEDYVYFDERNVNQDARSNAKKTMFQPKDQYHLPEMDDLSKIVDVNDPRLMTEEELRAYTDEFQNQLSSGLYDTMEVDFESAEFKALPLATQYQLVNTARLRSRLRMGYTADQLDERFKDRMEFSKFQIQRVAQRNYLTQKIMDIVGMDDGVSGQRIAGQKGSEYILNKNELGWTLALEKDQTRQARPIEINSDEESQEEKSQSEEEEEDVWEDVPLEQTSKVEHSHDEKAALETIGFHESNDSSDDQMEQLPAELRGFETQIQRNNLYEKLQEQAVLEKSFADGNKSGTEERLQKRPKNFVPFVLKGFDMKVLEDDKPVGIAPASSKSKNLKMKTAGMFDSPSLFATGSFEGETKVTSESDGSPAVTVTAALPATGLQDKNGKEEISSETNSSARDEKAESLPPPPHQAIRAAPLPSWFSKSLDDTKEQGNALTRENRRRQRELDEERGIEHEDSEESDIQDEDIVEVQKPESPAIESKRSVSPEILISDDEEEQLQLATSTTAAALQDRQPLPDVDPNNGSKSTEPIEEKEVVVIDDELAKQEAAYDEEEDEVLVDQLLGELEENERFTKALNNGRAHQDYVSEIQRLRTQVHHQQRDADEVSNVMVEECQMLLTLFGIPYITAPTEAEAQCAKLVELGLVDGVITDDSDCFLFGGSKIYKNMFNQSKWVERYDSEDLEAEFGLTRPRLIELAQLLGSDYTDGIPGIGPVQGLELLADFEGLSEFKQWWEEEQKRTRARPELSAFRRKFRQRHLTKIFLPEHFPDPHVRDAYLHPTVDDDPTAFEWGQPDLDKLRAYISSSTGWSRERVDEMLVPVIRDMNKPVSKLPVQSTLTDYMGVSPMKRMEVSHKRMHKAVEKLRERRL